MGSKPHEKMPAMEWGTSETDNFVNINKYIFCSNDDQESNEFAGNINNIGSRVKSLPKSTVLNNEVNDSEHHFVYNAGSSTKLAELESTEKSDMKQIRYSGFFSTMKIGNNEGLFPSAYKDTQETNIYSKQKGKL